MIVVEELVLDGAIPTRILVAFRLEINVATLIKTT